MTWMHAKPVKFILGLERLFDVLKGELPKGQVIEIVGKAGMGKTFICLCIALETLYQDLDSHVIWFDTIGTFPILRLQKMCQDESILQRLIIFETVDLEQLQDAIQEIHQILPDYKIPLIIFDNICVPFRTDYFQDIQERVDRIRELGLMVRRLKVEQNSNILVTNHFTTRMKGEKGELVTSLGENWSIMCDLELHLFEGEGGSGNNLRRVKIARSDIEDFLCDNFIIQVL